MGLCKFPDQGVVLLSHFRRWIVPAEVEEDFGGAWQSET